MKPELTDLRNERNRTIRADFDRYYKKGLRREIVIGMLSAKYYLKPNTIEAIIGYQGRYKNT